MQGPQLESFVEQFALVPTRVLAWPASDLPAVAVITPFFTSMFLHGGILHLLGNMWYLWIFGDNIEDRLGHVKYLLFYILCGLGAGIVHTATNSYSSIPTIGASGAVAGVLGAYLISYPFARVLTLIPLGFFTQIWEIPALVVLGAWFLLQFVYGAAATASADAGGVAWWAHVGGFVMGMLLLGLLPRRPRQSYGYTRS
jgi:membrane associated rhomboid family serine protease